jgi:hypothetical protein
MTTYYIILALIGVISIAATIMVGNNQSKTEVTNKYMKNTKGNILRLSYLNVISLLIWIVIMVAFIYS